MQTVDPCKNQVILVQGEDSKMGELIYLLRGAVLMKFIQNEPIPIRNIKEIHELVPNSKKISKISTDWSF